MEIAKRVDAPEDVASLVTSAMSRVAVGIYIRDAMNSRLVESASIQLDLEPVILADMNLSDESFAGFELLIVDADSARGLRNKLQLRKTPEEGFDPAIIAVYSRPQSGEMQQQPETGLYDGVLYLPILPGELAAKISLVLYAHRALVKRYETAFEELYLNRRIFRSVTSGISVASVSMEDLPLVYVNPAFEVMTGYSFEEVQGRNCRFLQQMSAPNVEVQRLPRAEFDRDQRAVETLRSAIRERRECLVVLRNYRKDGSMFWNELSLSPIRNREGVMTHIVGIQTDITARVEFETALRQSEKLAAVGRLAASIAHEINNPLESVMNLLYLAQRTEDMTETREFLAQADKEVQRVSLITSHSLRFYKQSTGPTAVSCHDLLSAVLSMYEGRAEHAGIQLERRDRQTSLVQCLESEIRQVLNNLVRNAIDAMHGAGGRLLVRSRAATDWRSGRQGVLMTIADTGGGMSAETIEQIYKPFFTTKGIAGTGLGLWISSEIVTRHYGQLRVRSSRCVGRGGTVFQLFLPLNQTVSAAVLRVSQA